MLSRIQRRNLASLLLIGLLVLVLVPGAARAAATAQGVALNAAASCTNADLDLTLTTVGALRESGLATNLAGQTLASFEQATPFLGTFSGTFVDYQISPLAPPQPANTLIGSYAYVGTTPPTSGTTAEFFVLYNCSTRQIVLSCYGPYGTCPQTAAQAKATIPIPALGLEGLALAALLLAASGLAALRRRA
ncbi:MAG TPA: hypothetical protein VET86_08555 [Casimicrobiaceae bacterium]|nr:hypothetical protein [Casimicrobiaceae bacterium]